MFDTFFRLVTFQDIISREPFAMAIYAIMASVVYTYMAYRYETALNAER